MHSVDVRYLNGESVRLDNCPTVGDIMVQLAERHNRFASDVLVFCAETGDHLLTTQKNSVHPKKSVQSSA